MPRSFVWSLIPPFVLWLVLFSPWTAGLVNFWGGMTCAALILLGTVSWFHRGWTRDIRITWVDTMWGVVLAAALWGIFWLGNQISAVLLPFSVSQIDSIYQLKTGSSLWLVGLALFLLIGPAEEIYWRGYVQKTLSARWNRNAGFLGMLVLYSLIHIWSGNFMLLMAAVVAGGFQGVFYRFFPNRLWALIVSHAVWDTAVFVLFPI